MPEATSPASAWTVSRGRMASTAMPIPMGPCSRAPRRRFGRPPYSLEYALRKSAFVLGVLERVAHLPRISADFEYFLAPPPQRSDLACLTFEKVVSRKRRMPATAACRTIDEGGFFSFGANCS